MLKATVYVTIKKSVLDPQGVAVQGALHSVGFRKLKVCGLASIWS